jgi:outer membrane protein assembly factor BamB
MRLREISLAMLWAVSLARPIASAVALALLFGPTTAAAQAPQPVLQRGYDAGVSGANLTETALNTSNVVPNTFGLVFKLPLDDSVLAQPLYVPSVVIPGQGTHNVVYVATMSDTLYAFDADTGAQLWSVNFATSVGATPVPYATFAFYGNRNIVGNLGILSTPVIDQSTNILYLVACTLENGGTTMVYRLHAVNIANGTEPYTNMPISGGYNRVTFDARDQIQRLSLVLSGNEVVFGFSALEEETDDEDGYAGWVMAYDKTTLLQSGAFATVTKGTTLGGGVWQSGRPPVVDSSGYVYVFVGNGYCTNTNPDTCSGWDGANNFGESALKLDPATGLNLLDWFTPEDWAYLDENDLDLSSSGPLLIPGTSLLAGGGKAGVMYVLKTANLGKETASDTGVAQEETITNEFRGGPVYWQRSSKNGGPLLFNWGASDWVKAYAFNGATFATTPSSQGSGTQIWPGGILALSADSDTPGSGVLWATVATSGDAENNPPVPGELHAFDAGNVSHELWNSTMNASRDGFGNFAKFVPPLVANGKVYVATWSNQLAVYGLLSTYTVSSTSLAFGSQTANVASAPQLITVTNTGTVVLPITSITLSGANSLQFSQSNTCGTSVAVGANCTISVEFKPNSTGSKSATLNVNTGDGAGTQTVALSGTGT